MPRIRYIKPSFFKDEDLAELSFKTRIFFAGLWTQADKEGRLEDRPKRLKVEIMPYDNVDIEAMLKELATPKKNSGRPIIVRYEVEGQRYIQILTWHKHQRPHHTEKESEIPPYPKGTEKGMGMGMEKQLNRSPKLKNGDITVKEPLSFPFEEIWAKYPKRVGRKEAERHFNASVKTEKDWQDINTALKNYLESERVTKGFILNGSTFFNNWKDWVDYQEPVCKKCNGTGRYVSGKGYDMVCDCPKGKAIKVPEHDRV